MARSYGDYTTNLPLKDLRNGQAWIAFRFDNKDLAPEHGGPARLLVPHLYLWKSAKWVQGITLMHTTNLAFGKDSATTTMGTHGGSSVIRATVMWRVGTVVALQDETATARTITLKVPDWPGHIAGQHVDVRLTASDGYSAVRSYSIASAPNAEKRVELTVERLPNGEVSPYLTQELAVGDRLELRGPIGGWFVWRTQQTEPIQLIAGGSGIVPLMAMIRSRASTGSTAPFRLLYSVREPGAVFYRDKLRRYQIAKIR